MSSRTTRIPDTFATQGAVRQTGGDLPVYRCNACGAEVVWAESRRTGRRYLANVSQGYRGQRYYVGADVHPRDCAELKAGRLAELTAREEAADAAISWTEQVQAAKARGDMDEVHRLLTTGIV